MSLGHPAAKRNAWSRNIGSILINACHKIVSTAVLDTPLIEAPMLAWVCVVTALVLTVNVPVVLPAGILIDVGTDTEPRLLVKAITTPPVGAGEEIVTVAVLDFPPFT